MIEIGEYSDKVSCKYLWVVVNQLPLHQVTNNGGPRPFMFALLIQVTVGQFTI